MVNRSHCGRPQAGDGRTVSFQVPQGMGPGHQVQVHGVQASLCPKIFPRAREDDALVRNLALPDVLIPRTPRTQESLPQESWSTPSGDILSAPGLRGCEWRPWALRGMLHFCLRRPACRFPTPARRSRFGSHNGRSPFGRLIRTRRLSQTQRRAQPCGCEAEMQVSFCTGGQHTGGWHDPCGELVAGEKRLAIPPADSAILPASRFFSSVWY